METFYVIKHDAAMAGKYLGCSVGRNPELFRKIPVWAVEWSETVRAENEKAAVIAARDIRSKKNKGVI